MRLLFQKKAAMRVDLIDSKTKRPIYSLQAHDALSGTRMVLSRCSQNNDGDEGEDEVGEATFRDIVSDKVRVGEVKRAAKDWLRHDGEIWTFTASGGAHYTWSLVEGDYVLQGSGGSSEAARLHTDGADVAKAYLEVDVSRQDQDEVLMSCIYLRLHDAKKTDTAGGTTLINPISMAGSRAGGGVLGGHHAPL